MGEKTENKKAGMNKKSLPESSKYFEENQDNRLESSHVVYLVFSFGHAMWPVRSEFPNQGWNPCPCIGSAQS